MSLLDTTIAQQRATNLSASATQGEVKSPVKGMRHAASRLRREVFCLPQTVALLAAQTETSAPASTHGLVTVGPFRDITGLNRNLSIPIAPNRRSALPCVDRLLAHTPSLALLREHGHTTMVTALRVVLVEARERVAGHSVVQVPASLPRSVSDEALIALSAQRLAVAARPRLRLVFNLTGTAAHPPWPRLAV